MDYITIENLEVYAKHGVLEEENRLGQKFLISAKLYYDFADAAREDDIEKAVNYAEVCSYITELMQDNTYKLIETVADKLAENILIRFNLIKEVEITVKKPWAPIGLPVGNVMATVKRGWEKVYLSIGSNMGDKKDNLDFVGKSLEENEKFKNLRVSKYIETEPYGDVEQDNFLNAALSVDTIMSPQELLAFANGLEAEKKRERVVHWGPRTLDVDILFYGSKIVNEDNLLIPHPDIANRTFVLEPMAEIAPYFIHPVTKDNILTMKNRLLN